MKTKTYTALLFILMLLGMAFLNTCKQEPDGAPPGPCPTPDTIYYNLRADDSPHLHLYSLGDTIKLQKDSVIYYFISQEIDTGYTLYQLPPQGCPGNFDKWQNINQTFRSVNYQYPLIVSNDQTYGVCSINIYFDQYSIFKYSCGIRAPFDYPQITIGTKIYSDVDKFIKKYDTTQYALYNTAYGVLQIVSNGKTWNRIP
jgi:hypothetical protein